MAAIRNPGLFVVASGDERNFRQRKAAGSRFLSLVTATYDRDAGPARFPLYEREKTVADGLNQLYS